MKKNIIGLAVAGIFGLTATMALAEDAYQGSWYALPGISIMHADNDLSADQASVGGFLRFGKEISEHWDVQIGLGYNQADEDSKAYRSGQYKQSLLGVDALYMFSRDKFRPFILAGLGVAQNKIDYNGANGGPGSTGNHTSWAADLGVGAQYLFTDQLGLQADLRQVWSRADANNGLFGGNGGRERDTVSNTYFNLGVIFKFGAPKQVAAAEPVAAPALVAAPEPAPMPAPEPAPAPVVCQPSTKNITISAETLFGFDKDNLKPEGKTILDNEVVTKMKDHPEFEFVLITGHTDRIGSEVYNQKLSQRRANVVKNYLVSQGVDASRLNAVGKGESAPVAECKGVRGKKLIECLAPNRRVELDATHPKQVGCE